MLTDRVLFTGTSLVSHPVLDQLFGGTLEPPKDDRVRGAGESALVVIDARLESNDLGEGGVAREALKAGVPVLIVAPGEGQLAGLAPVIGAAPSIPLQAVLITPNANRQEASRFEVTALGYPPHHRDDEPDHKKLGKEGKESRCGCAGARADHEDLSFRNFAVQVESRVTRGFNPAPLSLPDGLKYFQTTWNPSYSFTASRCDADNENCFTNGQGSVTVSTVVLGFLNQSASGNSQYLILESTYNVYPGALAQNDEEGRGLLNTRVQSNTGPTSGNFAAVDHIPTNGTNAWNESFSINISYRDPLGGYQVYTYTANVTQSIDSWSVQNSSSGTVIGSTWYINSPVNGINMGDTWDDAFSGAGHVELFPSASTGTVTAKEVSAWLTNTIQSGNVLVQANFYWDENVFYSTSCGLLICYRINRMGQTWHWWPSFYANFSSITPS